MIVVDTNVVAYLLLTGEQTADAERAFAQDPHWVAPVLWRSEFRSVLSLHIRRRLLTADRAFAVMEQAETLLGQQDYNAPSRQVLALIAQSRCSAYDCEFVALANDLETILVTADRRILTDFPNIAVALEMFGKGDEAESGMTEA